MNRNSYQGKHYPLSVLYHILCILVLYILPGITTNMISMVLFNLYLLSIVLHCQEGCEIHLVDKIQFNLLNF